jgi:hypothetical protein
MMMMMKQIIERLLKWTGEQESAKSTSLVPPLLSPRLCSSHKLLSCVPFPTSIAAAAAALRTKCVFTPFVDLSPSAFYSNSKRSL